MLMSKEIKNSTFTIVKRNSNFLIEKNNKFLKTPDGNLISIPYKRYNPGKEQADVSTLLDGLSQLC